MQIKHKIDAFLFTIFPDLKEGSDDLIVSILEKYYTYGPYKPKVSINERIVTIDIDTPSIIAQDTDYRRVVAFCEKQKYLDAKLILNKLIEKNPANSEYHRIMGQILSDEGEQDEAINCLIDSLRWDSKNGWALLMMGNIFAKFKNDVPTAVKYFDQAIIANPNDNIAINNIGYILMQEGRLEESKKYLLGALKIKNDYPNTHLAIGMIAEKENDLQSAFYSTIQAIKLNKSKDILYQKSLKQAFDIAKRIVDENEGEKIVREYLHKLEFLGGVEIDMEVAPDITTAAKIEFAENYNRNKHIVRYKTNYPAVQHLILHELIHLQFVIEAQKDDLNLLFMTTQSHKAPFFKSIEPSIQKLIEFGLKPDSISGYAESLFSGLNLQVYNTPIDLFIEDLIYKEYAELRPYQFLSFYNLVQQGITAVTDKKIVELSPKFVVSASKVYSIVGAIQFRDLYGIDCTRDFQATPYELKQAQGFYDEYLQYKADREPGEEYELVLHWAEDLKLEGYFELINEKEYRTKRTDIDSLLSSIEKDPYDLDSKDPYKEREEEKFQKTQESIGTNMAVVMFMLDALKFFTDMPVEQIKKIAFEIAFQGTQGYRPDKKDYRINLIPGKLFSGYHILAYYYVSWMLSAPEKVSELRLPFEKEYEMALRMNKSK